MTASLITALISTVVLFVVTAYSLMGSVPLLILKHDTPMDSRFVRGFFDLYYRAALVVAGATAVSYVFAERMALGLGAAALALLAFYLRRKVIAKMDSLRAEIQSGGSIAIAGFRRVHVTAILVNVVQLALIVWSLISLSVQ